MLKKLISLLILLPAIALAAGFTEGKDYQVISNPEARASNNKATSITEFFSYGCPWCYRLEKPLNEWTGAMGKNIQFERIPVVFKPDWDLYAKAYYTAKALALTDKLSPVLFKTIQDDKKPLNSKQSMIDLFVSQGVDKEIAKSAFENSPSIDMRVSNGMSLMARYQINAVPAFVINNKYKTDLQMAKSPERLFQIIDYLMRKSA